MSDQATHLVGIFVFAVLAMSAAMERAVAALIVFGGGTLIGCLLVIAADVYARKRHGR